MRKEKWKPVKNFEEFYEISSFGHVRSKRKGIIMKDRLNNRGYHIIDLIMRDNEKTKRKTALVHKLVADAFLNNTHQNPDGTKIKGRIQINHKDGNKDNNSIQNLEICDQSYNMKEAYRLGLRKYVSYEVTEEYREKMRKLSASPSAGKEIQMIDIESGNVLETFESSMDAVRKHPELELNHSSIRDAANHRRGIKSYKGYIWKFTGNITHGKR